MTTGPLALAAALVLGSAPVLAEEAPPAPPQGRGEWTAPWEITGRLRSLADGVSLELGGAVLELRFAGPAVAGGAPLGGTAPGARDLRATLSVDGRETSLLLRFVPPPGAAPAPVR